MGTASKSKEYVGRSSFGVGYDDVNNNSAGNKGSNAEDMQIGTVHSDGNNKSENAGEEMQEPQQQCTRGKKRRARKKRIRAAGSGDNLDSRRDK